MNKLQLTLAIVLVLVGLIAGVKILGAPKEVLVNLQTARAKGNPGSRKSNNVNSYNARLCPATYIFNNLFAGIE